MITVIIGGSGSGKSEYAEDLAVKTGHNPLVYIATMKPYDEESHIRILKHQAMRKGKNFTTIECFTGLAQLTVPKGAAVLLECMSNLAANEMFSDTKSKDSTLEIVKQGILSLNKQSKHLILVTNNVFEDGHPYDLETMEYLQSLGQINQWISSVADHVIEVIHGIPVPIK